MMKHGDYIKKARERQKLTQRELAFRTGYSQSYIDKIEKGRQRGSRRALRKIAEVLGLNWRLILVKSGVEIIQVPTMPKLDLDLDTEEFSKLNPEVKRLLLNLAPAIEDWLNRRPPPGG